MAGFLHEVRVVEEPILALKAFQIQIKEQKSAMVISIGGRKTEISVLK